MKVKLIGVRSVNFTTDDGKDISGVKLFIAYPDEDVYGNVVDSRFISDNVFVSFEIPFEELLAAIDSVIEIEINPKNKLVGINLCQKQPQK